MSIRDSFSKSAIASANETIKKLNPGMFLGAVVKPVTQHNPARALDSPGKARKASKCSVCISLVRFGKRKLDDDNLAAGFKPLRDTIARRLAVDDADSRLRWQYGQCETHGETGTLVVIECV